MTGQSPDYPAILRAYAAEVDLAVGKGSVEPELVQRLSALALELRDLRAHTYADEARKLFLRALALTSPTTGTAD